jgi:hypothetical protein
LKRDRKDGVMCKVGIIFSDWFVWRRQGQWGEMVGRKGRQGERRKKKEEKREAEKMKWT